MFAGLFCEEEQAGSGLESKHVKSNPNIPCPPRPRIQCGLAGIRNQGATCYLNSLLQTLFLTPEFREALFDLGDEELGRLEDKDLAGSKVRVIPIQLQKLFARLLLSDQQSVPSVDLTESFGWTNNEELQQHDVQELNRILFSAIEESLVGTLGTDLISKLYHGTVVNQIICTVCGKISEREEDFLDLTVTVAGNSDLENGLYNSYCEMESMDGRNQYRCEACNKLVDAKKGAKIRSVPEILTLSLLRFSFDFQKMQRFKESGKFVFPQSLDMAPYIEEATSPVMYKLFSVVIHKGGAYGGHYHAYLLDVDGLGKWTNPEEEVIQLPTDPSTGEVDFIECDSPVDLIHTILARSPAKTLSVDKICAEITKQTGVSWNKRFRRQHGSIHKYLEKHNEEFVIDQSTHLITLREITSVQKEGLAGGCPAAISDLSPEESLPNNKRTQSPAPDLGSCWFNFDDARVHPMREREIQKTFSGKSSAYMLFYRKESLVRPPEALGDPTYRLPHHLLSEVIQENEDLHFQREFYDMEINTISLHIHFGDLFEFVDGSLRPRTQTTKTELTIDRRKTVRDLKTAVLEVSEGRVADDFHIHLMKELVAGFHLYKDISCDGDLQLINTSVDDGNILFIWDGEKINGQCVPTGEACEPVFLNVIYGNPKSEYADGFPKNMTLYDFQVKASDRTNIPLSQINLKKITGEGVSQRLVEFTEDQMGSSLKDLQLADFDQIVAENRNSLGENVILTSTKVVLYVENKCSTTPVDGNRTTIRVEVDKDTSIAEVKVLVISKFDLCDVQDGGRLRIDHDTLGLRPPLHEQLTVEEASLTAGTTLILEAGPSPTSNQITLTFTSSDPKVDVVYKEVILDKSSTVGECLECFKRRVGLTEDRWHLRKTNWCGEAAEVLDDIDLPLGQSLVNDGDHLLLEEGKLPPKGYIRPCVVLYPTLERPYQSDTNSGGMLSWITSGIRDLLSLNQAPSGDSNGSETQEPLTIGEVEVSLQDTLEDFQQLVMTLPLVADINIPTTNFIRVRLIEDGRLTTVLCPPTQTLQKLKLKSCCRIAIQVLSQEEKLNANEIVLQVQQRVPETRMYMNPHEVIWDVSQGATVQSLKQTLSMALIIEEQYLHLAKHFPKRHEWLIIREQQHQSKKNQKGKKKGGQKCNLKNAPFYLRDGDMIGVKDMQFDQLRKDDFATLEDDYGQDEHQRQIEEKKKEREIRKKRQEEFSDFGPRNNRPEVALTIKVDNFR
ncbi:ubiquitin carboxyl-terminal hydrolase 40-like [Mizuhopecten yessoensis]|uniref:Ubiquitin carboxyl-terminal hydrolase 40 n=1 Tax=Mizuhopecten yessoensis TaxID=6573 RepID=A0A210Q393_MIZYE|nr:ubiquitin carboxyl-terminal hydrolase 40-like [Mizuhopecten yessoensis]OWF43139.1 Ubiquitin carboxyl-terminal hydrolase 40 [Mizuhopecten yessoensis]